MSRVIDGLPLLVTLAGRMGTGTLGAILPGGGLRAKDVAQVVKATGVREVHTSGRTKDSPMVSGSGEFPGLRLPDPVELKAMLAALAG
jgi:copper homeostasis protein CutC